MSFLIAYDVINPGIPLPRAHFGELCRRSLWPSPCCPLKPGTKQSSLQIYKAFQNSCSALQLLSFQSFVYLGIKYFSIALIYLFFNFLCRFVFGHSQHTVILAEVNAMVLNARHSLGRTTSTRLHLFERRQQLLVLQDVCLP